MASDTARMATYKHFNQPPEQEKNGSNSNGTAVPSIDGELPDAAAATTEADETAKTTEAGANGTPPPSQPPAAPEMERSSSHQVLTRGVARKDPLAALNELAAVAASDSKERTSREKDHFAPVLPNYHAVMRSDKSGAPTPGGISALQADSDFQMIRSLRPSANAEDETMADAGNGDAEEDDTNPDTLRHKLLDQALSTPGTAPPFRTPNLETGPAHVGKTGVERPPGTGFAPLGTYMEQQAAKAHVNASSAATEAGVLGEAGGAMAAALRGQFAGGEPMSRASSAAGNSEVEGAASGTRGRGKGKLV